MLEKQQFSQTEKEALGIAIGVLSWTSLAENRRKELQRKLKAKSKFN